MRKKLMAIAAIATLAVSALAVPQSAEARGGRIAAGVAAGLIGGAIASSAYGNGYGPGYGYYGRPAYATSPGYYGDCSWQRQQFWDGYGWRVRRVRVCS